ncbi:MAG TPA: tannase/feruloyl esterase family alpha/beta hydrolase [Gammaproteobacteria bacterium]
MGDHKQEHKKISAGCLAVLAAASLMPLRVTVAQQPFPLLGPDEMPAATACSALGELELSELSGITAAWNRAGPSPIAELGNDGEARELAAHCRVQGRIEPSIGFEVWLPAAEDWNGRFVAVGGAGTAGNISYQRMAPMLDQGYATASTDTGHTAGDWEWMSDESLLRDFSYRAIYEMTAKSNAVVRSFYQRPASFRYFNGCSLGGRQGLVEAQRFPRDYDGIVAGAPVNAYIDTRMTQIWAMQVAQPGSPGQTLLDEAALDLVAATATAQCDTLDGVADGVLEDPRRCNFDPGRLQCGVAAPGRCLSSAQVEAVRQMYRGPRLPVTGQIAPGFPVGSEAGWSFASAAEPPVISLQFLRRVIFDDPLWTWRRFDLESDVALAREQAGWLMDATSPELGNFRDQGGKLLLYHGWNDSNNSALATITYYEAIENELATRPNPLSIATPEFARLFLVPGMGHCAGGIGTSQFDAQRAIENWVERGIAPDRIEAERVDAEGTVIRTRPLCPYPQTARYRGTGNSDRSGSFVCSQ